MHGRPRETRLFGMGYKLVSAVLERISINLGTVVRGLRVHLPEGLELKLTADEHDLFGFHARLSNWSLTATAGLNISATAGNELRVSLHAMASPELTIDWKQCSIEQAALNVRTLALGVDNDDRKTRWITNALCGKWHSGRRGGLPCDTIRSGDATPATPASRTSQKRNHNLLAAYPSSDSAFILLGRLPNMPIKTGADSQLDRDVACCKACEANGDCDQFVTSSVADECYLKSVGIKDDKRVHNLKGFYTPIEGDTRPKNDDRHDNNIAHYAGVGHEECAQLCTEEHPDCDVWETLKGNPGGDCAMKGMTKPAGILNKGVRGLTDVFAGLIIKCVANIALKKVCEGAMDEWQELVDEGDDITDFGVDGDDEFEFTFDGVDEAFLNTLSLDCNDDSECAANLESWLGRTFALGGGSSGDLATLKAIDGRLQPLLNALTGEIHTSLVAAMAEQTAAPVGFVLGGFLTKCLTDPRACGVRKVEP